MTISNFPKDRVSTLLGNLSKAWPWAATEQGYDFWHALTTDLAVTAGVEDFVLQDRSFTGHDSDLIGAITAELSALDDVSFPRSYIAYRGWAEIEGMDDLMDDKFNEARKLAEAKATLHEVKKAVHSRSRHNQASDILAALFFIHQANVETAAAKAEVAVANELPTEALQSLYKLLVEGARDGVVTHGELPNLVRQHSQIGIAQVEVSIKDGPQILLEDGPYHERFPLVLQCISARQNVALIGPAGSGKTTMAEQVATALGLSFFFTGAIQSEYKLLGFIDAQSNYKPTTFRQAYEFGGVFLFDEIDASSPQTLLAFNAALANGQCDFPDGMVKRHKDFVAIAAGNTFWGGRDRVYVGRNQLDAASMDRFVFIEMDYDGALERSLAGNSTWVDYVQAARAATMELGIRHVISPRASIAGSKLFEQGISGDTVAQLVLWKGLAPAEADKIRGKMPLNGTIPQLLIREASLETAGQMVKRVSTAQRGVNLLSAVA